MKQEVRVSEVGRAQSGQKPDGFHVRGGIGMALGPCALLQAPSPCELSPATLTFLQDMALTISLL